MHHGRDRGRDMREESIDPKTGSYRYSTEVLDRLTGLKKVDRASRVGWFSRQGEAIQVEVIRCQTELMSAYQNEQRAKVSAGNSHLEEVSLAFLVLAIAKIRDLEKALKRRGDSPNLNKIMDRRVATMKARGRKKRAPERERLEKQFFFVVQRLREEKGLSWREVAKYMTEHHNTNWSFSWVRNNYESIKNARALAGIAS